MISRETNTRAHVSRFYTDAEYRTWCEKTAFWVGAHEKLATTKKKQPATTADREQFKTRFGRLGVSIARDNQGIFAFTHRCRSPSYPSVAAMNEKRVKFVESTG